MVTFSDINLPKFCPKFNCEFCDYNTSKKSSFDDHLQSKKHKYLSVLDKSDINSAKILHLEKKYMCPTCDKTYLSRNGLWLHKKKCLNKKDKQDKEYKKDKEEKQEKQEEINDESLSDITNKDDLIFILIKQNSELLELMKNGTNNTTINNSTNNTNNSNNKTFNLQVFLNETCKDAMNITDFIDSIKLQLSDLEKVGELGYIEGISNIITKNLIALDVSLRPIHCTDKKRDILYIKDKDKWEKEDEDKKHIRNLIKKVSNKNINMISKFKEAHPDCGTHDSKYSDQYNKIILEAMGGKGDDTTKEKEDKIIKNISKKVVIDKYKDE
jgi:hypothetical protein